MLLEGGLLCAMQAAASATGNSPEVAGAQVDVAVEQNPIKDDSEVAPSFTCPPINAFVTVKVPSWSMHLWKVFLGQ